MFPATVLVAILTKFDVGVTLLASGLGTIVALLINGGRYLSTTAPHLATSQSSSR